MLKHLAIPALAATTVVLGVTPATVSAPVVCPPGSAVDAVSGQCTITITTPGGDGHSGGTKNGQGAAKPAKRTCTYTLGGKSSMVPCSGKDGWWSQAQQAYCKAASPQPPADAPVWGGRTEGQIYDCTRPGLAQGLVVPVFQIWAAKPPAGAPPDPRALAKRAIATMKLKAISIGIVPEPKPGYVGLVGLPVWMWDANPSRATWGPVTKSASAGGYTVTATAKVDRVVWSMGDGEVVVCRTPGTPYEDSFGMQESPDCGYMYTRQGHYVVSARSYWTVDWTGMGLSGSIDLSFMNSVRLTIGEAQVLTQ